MSITREDIERKLEEWSVCGSNDEEIDGLRDLVNDVLLPLAFPTVEEAFGEPLYSVRVGKDTAEADSYSGAALALHTLAKENGD